MPLKRQLGKLLIQARALPDTVDVKNLTCEVSFSTGAKVLRTPYWDEPYYEQLDIAPNSVRMDRINNGAAPFLNSHEADDLDDVIGVILKAWLDNGVGRALVKFSSRAEVQPIFQDVQDGILKNISVGYMVYRYEEITGENEKIPTFIARDWEPFEISLVPIPADATAQVRKQNSQTNECEFIKRNEASLSTENEGNNMPPEIEPNKEVVPAKVVEPAVDTKKAVDEARTLAINEERTRAADIKAATRMAKLPEAMAEKLINDGVTIDEARKQIINELAKVDEQTATRNTGIKDIKIVESENRMAAAENAILHRASPKLHVLTEEGRHFAGLSLVEVARSFLEANGVRTRGMFPAEIAKRAFEVRGGGAESTSDLPSLLENIATKYLRQGYEASPQTFWAITQQRSAKDFKQISGVMFGDAPNLELVLEGGEIKRGSITDSAEKYALLTYAKIVALTRQTVINDDLNALTLIPQKLGQAAGDLESDTVWNLILANAALADGVALFHATHKNLGTGSALDVTNVGLARKKFRQQKNTQGRPMRLDPKCLIVSSADETAAEQVVGPIVPNQSSSVNPFTSKLSILCEPRLDVASGSQPWYIGGDSSQCDMIHAAYLEGQQGAYLETRQGFDVDGMEIKVRLDFAAKVMDFRALYKNPGA